MIDTVAHRCYARALLTAAVQKECVDDVRRDLGQVRTWLASNREFYVFVACDSIGKKEQRVAVLLKLGAGGWHGVTSAFLQKLEAAHELHLLPGIITDFEDVYRAWAGIVRVQVRSAAPLEPGQRDELTRRLAADRAVRLDLHYAVDPGLLGGFVVRVADRIYDASIAGRLTRLRRQLLDT